jgi:hypothetical protein
MEVVLLTVTLASLATAIGTSFLAWRVMRAERLRSEARIAALAADLGLDESERPMRAERPQPEATPVAAPVMASVIPAPEVELPLGDATVNASQGMFAVRPRGRSMPRVVAGVGVAAAVVALVIGTLVMTSDRSTSTQAKPQAAPTAATAPAQAVASTSATSEVPLELIALGHEREKDRLTVRGVVRGTSTAESRPLTAVVLLFNRDGSEIGSGRAEVGPAAPGQAGERPFVISVPSAGEVGRYRISFRSDDHVVPHVDRRTQPGIAKPAVLNVASSQF